MLHHLGSRNTNVSLWKFIVVLLLTATFRSKISGPREYTRMRQIRATVILSQLFGRFYERPSSSPTSQSIQ